MSTKRKGLTLQEVLVVLALIAILVSLLLPAAQGARQSAQRLQCQANLRQIGIALQSYESTHGMWAPGSINGVSWEVVILPQIDRANLYQSYLALQRPFLGVPELRKVVLPLYSCPSDPEPAISKIAKPVAATNYLANSGSGTMLHGFNGMFRLYEAELINLDGGPIRS